MLYYYVTAGLRTSLLITDTTQYVITTMNTLRRTHCFELGVSGGQCPQGRGHGTSKFRCDQVRDMGVLELLRTEGTRASPIRQRAQEHVRCQVLGVQRLKGKGTERWEGDLTVDGTL